MKFSPFKSCLNIRVSQAGPFSFSTINFSMLVKAILHTTFLFIVMTGLTRTIAAQTQGTFIKSDATTQGNWTAGYGADGYQIINQATNYPTYARVSTSGQSVWSWAASTSDTRALQKPGLTDRIAATGFSNTSMSIDLSFTDGLAHQVALYFLDWDYRGRGQQVEVLNATTGAVLDSRAISNFSGGYYLVWNLSGNIRLRVTRTAGSNAVVSGLFFGMSALARPLAAPTVSFVKVDSTTQGNWKSAYGRDGYNVVSDAVLNPSYAQVSATGQSAWTWAASSSEARALERATSTGRIAATWFANTSFTLDVNLSDGQIHRVALYCLDWDGGGRAQKLEVIANNTVRDTRTISGFSGGQYVVWDLSGRVQIRVTRVSGNNAVVSGVFFGLAGTSIPTASPTPISTDTTPPVISSPTCSNITSTSATALWTTNEKSDSKVEYGTTTAYGNIRTLTNAVMSHQVDLIGLAPSTVYHYRVSSMDAAGNVAVSGDFTYTTASATTSVAGDPELPRTLLDTTFRAPTGRIITVNAGADLQAALNAAVPGDTLILQAGATFLAPSGGFVLPAKSNPNNQWIVVQTANLTNLPMTGVRVTPAYATAMPKILSRDTTPAISTAQGANYWRLIGLEVSLNATAIADATVAGAAINYGLVNLGSGTETNAANQPSDLIIERCYIHGLPRKNVRRGVTLNSRRTAVIDSYLSDFHETGSDSQAICGWNGAGPFKIVNNYLEGAGENILFGGADPRTANLVPADIEIRRNHLFKPLSWYSANPSFAGIAWSVKNIFELKNARRVLIDGNVLENNWPHSQNGFSVLFTVRNQEGTAPWSVVEDITFTNNIVRHVSSGINILGRDDLQASGQARRLKIKNNVFEDINASAWGGVGRFLQITDTIDAKFENNTILHSGNICTAYTNLNSPSNSGFIYRNNISAHNAYGFIGDGTGVGFSTLNTFFPSSTFVGNILAGGPSSSYPAGNFFPLSLDAVGFVNLVGGDYHLMLTSPYKNKGSDGSDPGANIDQIRNATSGVTL